MILVNKNITACASLLTLIMMVGCASSPDTASVSTGESAATTGDPDRIICKREKDTGSRLASRTCKTAREWEEERVRNQEAMRNANKSPQGPSNLPSLGGG